MDTTGLSRVAGTWLTFGPLLLLAGAAVVSGLALLLRYRVSVGVVRLQIRWYIAAGMLLVITYSSQLLSLVFLGPRDPRGEFVEAANHLALALPPIAMTMAILRNRLYEIDTIISRAFVYGVLAGIYAAGIRLFNVIFSAVTGDTSDISLVLTTLLLATTFTPIKGRLEHFAARRLITHPDPAHADGPPETHPEAPLDDLLADPRLVTLLDDRIAAALRVRLPARTRRPARPAAGAAGAPPEA